MKFIPHFQDLLKLSAILTVLAGTAKAEFQKILDPSAMDLSVDACEDFYKYSCGGWLSHVEIPADVPLWGRAFSTIREENLTVLKTILEEAAEHGHNDASGHKKT